MKPQTHSATTLPPHWVCNDSFLASVLQEENSRRQKVSGKWSLSNSASFIPGSQVRGHSLNTWPVPEIKRPLCCAFSHNGWCGWNNRLTVITDHVTTIRLSPEARIPMALRVRSRQGKETFPSNSNSLLLGTNNFIGTGRSETGLCEFCRLHA